MSKGQINRGFLLTLFFALVVIAFFFLVYPIIGFIMGVIWIVLITLVVIPPTIYNYREKKRLAIFNSKKDHFRNKYPKSYLVYGFSLDRSEEKWIEYEQLLESWQALKSHLKDSYPNAYRLFCEEHGIDDNNSLENNTWGHIKKQELQKISEDKWLEIEQFEKSWLDRKTYVQSHFPNGYNVFCRENKINIENKKSAESTWKQEHKEEFQKISKDKWLHLDKEESNRFLEEQRLEAIRIENQKKYKLILERYPNGFDRWLLNHKESSDNYLQIVNAESTIRELENICLEEISACVQSWNTIGNMKVFSMYPYYPTTCDFTIYPAHIRARELIWQFKNGVDPHIEKPTYHNLGTPFFNKSQTKRNNSATDSIICDMQTVLSYFFNEKQKELTLVCVNASSQISHEKRFKEFSSELCNKTGMVNAYPQILITKDGSPKHKGGTDKAELNWNNEFFKGRFVILFDDVITKGNSMLSYKYKLEEMGAYVIGGITIGKTTHTMDHSEFPIYIIRKQLQERQEEENRNRDWTVKSIRPFNENELTSVDRAVTVASKFGIAVCLYMKNGTQKYIQLSKDSDVGVGETLDLSLAKVLTLTQDGSNEIFRLKY